MIFMNPKKAIFLDRDGTLNKDIGFNFKSKKYRLLYGVVDGLKKLKNNFSFFIITNQPGIGLGLYTYEGFYNFHTLLIDELKRHGITIEETYYCPHIPEENCDCRKPKTKFIELCVKKYGPLDLKNSWMIGDHPSDIEFGKNAGCKTIYLTTGHGSKHLKDLKKKNIKPDFIAKNFLIAAEYIKNRK